MTAFASRRQLAACYKAAHTQGLWRVISFAFCHMGAWLSPASLWQTRASGRHPGILGGRITRNAYTSELIERTLGPETAAG